MTKSRSVENRLIATLMDEHRMILKALSVLRIVAKLVAGRRSVELRDLRSLLRFFAVYADKVHHHAEEDLLFDRLADMAPRSLRRMMEQLITQHVMGRFLVSRISEAVVEAAAGQRGWRKKFVEGAQAYDTLLSCHICSEDHHVFPIAEKVISRKHIRVKGGFHSTLELKKGLEKSLHRLALKYGSSDQDSDIRHHCGRSTAAS